MNRALRPVLLTMYLLGAALILNAPVLAAAPTAANAVSSLHVSHEFIFNAINFILLVILFVYLYRKRGKAFFDERSESIQKSLEESRQALEKSQAKLADSEKKLAGLQEEVQALKKRAEAEIAEEQERMLQAADDEAQKIEEFAKARIQAATNAAKLELKDYVVAQALKQASSLIKQRMDETNRERLVSFFLADLSSKTKNN